MQAPIHINWLNPLCVYFRETCKIPQNRLAASGVEALRVGIHGTPQAWEKHLRWNITARRLRAGQQPQRCGRDWAGPGRCPCGLSRPSDQKHVEPADKLKNDVAYSPGIFEIAHKPDEYPGSDDMMHSAKVMGAALEVLLLPALD